MQFLWVQSIRNDLEGDKFLNVKALLGLIPRYFGLDKNHLGRWKPFVAKPVVKTQRKMKQPYGRGMSLRKLKDHQLWWQRAE